MTSPTRFPQVQAFFDPRTATVSYLVADPAAKRGAIIDPVLDFDASTARVSTASADAILAAAREQGLTISHVLETHAHADHLSAAHYLREVTGADIGIGANITQVQRLFAPMFGATDVSADGHEFDELWEDGATFRIGGLEARVLHTPGHTPACVTYVIGDAAFVGDTLFMPDYGTARADFPGGDAATLYRSIHRILELPAATRVFVGHDYLPAGRKLPAWESTVDEQRADNVHVHDGVSEAEFVAKRTARDRTLAAPALILPSLQVNIRAGDLPPAEGGRRYLRLPVNALGGDRG
jgi:glyoxylase-like metal-dependent hydrolase (beta-lactamase superfamily II)